MSELRLGALSADEKAASSTYKIWRHKAGDLYVTHRSMGGRFKISMHASGLWKLEDRKAGRRTTWEPTQAVLDEAEPAVRILVPGGGLRYPPPEDVPGDKVSWATFQPDTKAIEFRIHLEPGGRYLVSPPGVTVIEKTLGVHRGRHIIVSIVWWDHLPIEDFVATSPDAGFADAMRRVEAGTSVASYWGVAGGTCFAVDDVRAQAES